jgi:hypothetical protein
MYTYTQNSAGISIVYELSKAIQVATGYRYAQVDAAEDAFDFDQNRMLFTVRYQF